jgi:DNA invertase Pin-like site-specific DNA recombinase
VRAAIERIGYVPNEAARILKGNRSSVLGLIVIPAALYMRVSTLDQHPETQLHELRQMAGQRGYQLVEEYTDRISGAKARRPGLDALMRDARRGRFKVVLVWACDRIARLTKHFLEVLDEPNRLGIEFISFREQIDTAGPLGRAIIIIIGAVAELERSLIVERVRAGMRRAKLEVRHIGRIALVLDRPAILRGRQSGQSLGQLAKSHRVSRSTIGGVLQENVRIGPATAVPEGVKNAAA